MKKKPAEPRARERSDAKTPDSKTRSQAEADTVARAVLEALSAHDQL
jgi:hypothetical protein